MTTMAQPAFREATIRLDAVRINTESAHRALTPAGLCADFGGDASGHGAVLCASAVRDGGARMFLVPRLDEAAELRRAGVEIPVISWLHAPGETFELAAVEAITPAVRSAAELAAAVAAGVGEVLLVPETGEGMPGFAREEWAESWRAAAAVPAVGILLALPAPGTAGRSEAIAAAEWAIEVARSAGAEPGRIVVCGGGGSGPLPEWATDGCVGAELFGVGARAPRVPQERIPAMRLWAPVVTVKAVPARQGVSYGHTYRTTSATTLALVCLGYGDGVDRAAGNIAPVALGARHYTIAGRVAMDAHVVDVGDDPAPRPGDPAVLFGDPAAGEPSVAGWADALGVSSAEITTRVSPRVRRSPE